MTDNGSSERPSARAGRPGQRKRADAHHGAKERPSTMQVRRGSSRA
ncbi:hypothetical protein [Streptomyces sp. GQFP]|nr:hypothetical protein [Streptomyces sp. GQFP]UIX29849.1 hypothetical protein LUX31_07260 [Streptomyces sp. GQFP]